VNEKFDDTKGVNKSCRSKKDRQCKGQQTKGQKRQTMLYSTLHRNLQIEQHECN